VLTAAHVVDGADHCKVRPLLTRDWLSGSVKWRNETADVAVIELAGEAPPLSPGSPAPRWGEVTDTEQTWVTAMGFPWAQERRSTTGRSRDSEQLFGFISPGTSAKAGNYGVTVRTSRPGDRASGSAWAGMSGAALFAGPFLVGVVVADSPRFRRDRLEAVPVAPLLRDGPLADLLGTSAERVASVGPRFGLQITAETYIVVRPPYQAATDLEGSCEPARLLLPEYGFVPFASRDRELTELEAWCLDQPRPALVRLIIGAGGSGKTRLAAETCRRMAGHGWQAGFAERGAAERTKLEFDLPTLLVVDDADSKVPLLTDLAMRMSGWQDGHPKTRLLLLARHAEGWWDLLNRRTKRFVHQIEDKAPLELREGELTGNDRAEHHRRALQVFADKMETPVTPAMQAPPDLKDAAFANPLLVHMHALLTVCGAQLPAEGGIREKILAAVLDRERNLWDETFPPNVAAGDETPQQAVIVATLFSPRTQEDTAEAMRVIGDLKEASQGDRAAVAEWLHKLYPGNDARYVAPMRPDLLAEQLLASYSRLNDLVLEGSDRITTPEQAVRILTELYRAAPKRKVIHDALAAFLAARLEALLKLAIDNRSGPLPNALDLAIREAPQPQIAAAFLDLNKDQDQLPAGSTALAMLAADLTVQAVEEHRKQAVCQAARLAESLRSLADRLARVEQWDKARDAIKESVRIYHRLFDTDPDTFRPDLARSLNSQAMRLAELGQPEAALDAIQEAVSIFETPEEAPNTAYVLQTLSHRLADLGQPKEALEAIEQAVRFYRELAKADQDTYLPALVGALNSQAMRQADVGEPDLALRTIEEAIPIARLLAGASADEYKPKLADVLHTQSHRQAELGHYPEAFEAIAEAVRIYRSLRKEQPASYRQEMANALHYQSDRLRDPEQQREALETINEAVGILEDLADGHFEAFGKDLAGALNSQSDRLRDLGQRAEALTTIQKAVDIYRQLEEPHRHARQPDLASALNSESIVLAQLGRSQEALEAIEEAVDIDVQWAKKVPARYKPKLADVLYTQSHRLAELGRYPEACNAIRRAVGIYREFARKYPGRFQPELASALHAQSDLLRCLGRRDDALKSIQAATKIYGLLAKEDPGTFLPNLAGSLNIQAVQLADAGKPEEALKTIDEAISIFSPRAEEWPDEMADLLHTRAYRLAKLGRQDEALDAIGAAVRSYRQLAKANPEAFRDKLAEVLRSQSVLTGG
jgi:Trypsin-like peptidase domain/Tetratricopeptide repeat/Anaphase-promoting complex subunit 5